VVEECAVLNLVAMMTLCWERMRRQCYCQYRRLHASRPDCVYLRPPLPQYDLVLIHYLVIFPRLRYLPTSPSRRHEGRVRNYRFACEGGGTVQLHRLSNLRYKYLNIYIHSRPREVRALNRLMPKYTTTTSPITCIHCLTAISFPCHCVVNHDAN